MALALGPDVAGSEHDAVLRRSLANYVLSFF